MKKYGLQLRVPPSQQKKQTSNPPLHPPIFSADDNVEDINGEIARQATKKKVLKDHKKALAEDPLAFVYDGVYNQMKEATACPLMQDRQEKKSKYIHTLTAKAKERERDHEVVYDRKLSGRSIEDLFYADKEKFVTSAYKNELAEVAKWMKEVRQLREEKDDVTKKRDISASYFNLGRNVAFGAGGVESKKEMKVNASDRDVDLVTKKRDISDFYFNLRKNVALGAGGVESRKEVKVNADNSEKDVSLVIKPPSSFGAEKDGDQAGLSVPYETNVDTSDRKVVPTDSLQVSNVKPKPMADQSDQDPHKKCEAALSAVKVRFLACKRAKQQ